jgi:crotonobetainyl-CoA:carnitine CoA-transferase CaiB-like acyl-CoA transferase
VSYSAISGFRVIDLGIITAGASTSALLADLGAEVIKVEGPGYLDPFRSWSGRATSSAWWNESPQFKATNRNKKGICLDLKADAGREIFLRLVAEADVVLENFRFGVLKKLGIDYDTLSRVNERIILASISSQGASGPLASRVSYGSSLEASSGLSSLMRYPDGQPQITGKAFNYPDQVVSLFAAGAILAALVDRERTKRGAFLDLSQRELTSFLIGEAIMASGASSTVEGRYPVGSPAVVNRTFLTSDDQWVAVTISSSAAERARLLLSSELDDKKVEVWMRSRPAAEAVRGLRSAGVAAEIAWRANGYEDLDPIRLRQSFAAGEDGTTVKGLPLRLGEDDLQRFTAAPQLGRDNRACALDMLGLTESEYDSLVGQGVFTQAPR